MTVSDVCIILREVIGMSDDLFDAGLVEEAHEYLSNNLEEFIIQLLDADAKQELKVSLNNPTLTTVD